MIRAVFTDAMNTVFMPKGGRWALYQRLLDECAGIEASEINIESVYKRERQGKEKTTSIPEGKLPPGFYREYWSEINAAIVLAFKPEIGKEVALRIGEQIYLEVMGNPEHYQFESSVADAIRSLCNRSVSVFLTTNQEPDCIQGLVNHFGVGGLFTRVITSDETGYKKPDPRFFKEAIEISKIPANQIAVVGNNPTNDMKGAAEAGILQRFLYDPRGEHGDTETEVSFTKIQLLDQLVDYIE